MKYSPEQYAQALYEALSGTKPDHHEQILTNFAGLLKENGDLEMFSKIEEQFTVYEKTAKGITVASVTSAKKLSSINEEKLIRELNYYVGSKVEIKKKVDEGLLGGVVIRIGDSLIDGSIKKNLRDLKTNLSR